MSLVGKREEIAAALSGITGVTGYPYRPGTPRTGDAWPLVGPMERDQLSGQFEVTWRVFVTLPTDEQAASEWIDSHRDDLWDALEETAYLDTIEPVVISASGNDTRALQITMRSE